MHNETTEAAEPHYILAAKLCEPNYETEMKFLETELAFVERKLSERPDMWSWVSIPALGFFQRKDWRKYRHDLEHYEKQLEKYSEEVANGILPVKFAVYNASSVPDEHVAVRIRVEEGRVDEHKKAPARPPRMDAPGHVGSKFNFTLFAGFTRRNVKIGPHVVSAELSSLNEHDGAMLVNQLLHIHCGPDTQVTYEVRSMNVVHEAGEVEI